MSGLAVAQPGQYYSDEQLRLCLVFLSAYGVLRISHINDQPVESWGTPLSTRRRPDGDTVDQYLNTIIQGEEDQAPMPPTLLGQVRPGGLIETAQLNSLVGWAQAGLLKERVWHFDGHTIEYTGQADIGKTKHGTKEKSVKAVKRFTLYNGINAYSAYYPASVPFADALRQMVSKANAVLPSAYRIRKLSFDKEGWDAKLLQWLEIEQDIRPLTWVKATAPNRRLLGAVPPSEFVPLEGEITVGKSERKTRVLQIADTKVFFPNLGQRRVVVLETVAGTRVGIYTTASHSQQAPLDDEQAMTTVGILNAMRFQQRVENGFKVDKHEMNSDALPTHKVHQVHQTEPYDVARAEREIASAEKRLLKYDVQDTQYQRLLDERQIGKHELNLLHTRGHRLRIKAQRQIEKLKAELDSVEVDEKGRTVRSYTTQTLDLRKLTLLNLFKTHASVALSILAQQLGIAGAGPARLRREFLPFGDRVEFDHQQRVVTIYAQRFPRGRTQQAYERLCALLYDIPVSLERNGVSYRVRFSW